MAEIVQREVPHQDVEQITSIGERFEPVKLDGRLVCRICLHEMLCLINADSFHPEEVQCIRYRITHFEPVCRIGALFSPFASQREIQDAIPYRHMPMESLQHLAVKIQTGC